MSNIKIRIVVEGQSEQVFVKDVLAPYMSFKGIYLFPSPIGHKGGDVRFVKAMSDIAVYFKQSEDVYVSTMFDYFRIDSEWPGMMDINRLRKSGSSISAEQKAKTLENAMKKEIVNRFPQYNPEKRFIPYIQMHEFEALLFSDLGSLAKGANIDLSMIQAILNKYNNAPEEINDDPEKTPSKRLEALNHRYKKKKMAEAISKEIGIPTIRAKCPHFDRWLAIMESLPPLS